MKIFNGVFLFCVCTCYPLIAGAQQRSFQLPPGVAVAINPVNVDPAQEIGAIRLPPGFSISLYAEGVDGARSMAISPRGTLFVGTRRNAQRQPMDKVYAVVDRDGDQRADEVITIARGLNTPNGVAFRDGDLYVAEINRILRFKDIESNLDNPPEPEVVTDTYPEEAHHGWKFIRFGPDGRLYVPVGAPCNTCEPDADHGVITSINADGSDKQIFARGIRNSVGFDWDPRTGDLWFTDNGRDVWGDDIPPEELNHAPEPGRHFGYPYRYGKSLVDTQFQTSMTDKDFTPATLELPAHNAAIGMRFYNGEMFPAKYKNRIFIAAHGSWNRSVPDGYCIFAVDIKDSKVNGYETFASGWLTADKHFWGRPVDIENMPDGSILVSDDHAGVIYRISYNN